jgi:hypothetical protein
MKMVFSVAGGIILAFFALCFLDGVATEYNRRRTEEQREPTARARSAKQEQQREAEAAKLLEKYQAEKQYKLDSDARYTSHLLLTEQYIGTKAQKELGRIIQEELTAMTKPGWGIKESPLGGVAS